MMIIYLMAALAFMLFFLLAGVGVILRGKSIRGSCGGVMVLGPDGEPLTCSTCPNRKKGAKHHTKECPSSAK